MRASSAAVFGNRYMVEVVTAAVAMAPHANDLLTVRMLAHRADLADSVVRPVVRRLVDAGVFEPHSQKRPRGPSYHRISSDRRLWDALVQTCSALQVAKPSTS